MDPPPALLDIATPSEVALLDFVRARVSPSMIHEIAQNDYGHDAKKREIAILEQLGPTPVLGVLPYDLVEPLELEQWSYPNLADSDGQLQRLLACIILLRNVAFVSGEEPHADIERSAATVIWLVRGSIVLGSEPSRLALRFLLWLHDKQSDPRLRAFVGFGTLLLQVQEDLAGQNLLNTCTWVEDEEQFAREQLPELEIHSSTWLLGLSCYEDDSARSFPWWDTIEQVIAARSGHFSREVESALRRMHGRLLR
jgi:hypothetical protein